MQIDNKKTTKQSISVIEGLEDAAKCHGNKVWGIYANDTDEDANDTRGNLSAKDFIAGGCWHKETHYDPLLELCGEFNENSVELLRFWHVMEDAADNLQYPDNYLKAINSLKVTIEKAKQLLNK